MTVLEAAIRGGGVAILSLLTLLFLRDAGRLAAGRYAALFALGAACDLIANAPIFRDVRAIWIAPLRILAAGDSAVFWIAVAALFDDAFEASWPHVGAWVMLVAFGVFNSFAPYPWWMLPHHGLALLCVGAALWTVVSGRTDDLDEGRRRLRLTFAVSVGGFIVVTMVVQASSVASAAPVIDEATATGTLGLAFFFAVVLLSLTPGAMLKPLALAPAAKPRASPDPVDDPLDPREASMLEALRRELEQNRAYREETLTIAGLAARLSVQEYRLRQLINQRLGYRNFAAFLNGYRLEEAMAALADPSQVETPILTIALDTGFGSIGPFNRAFKARTGKTPSEFRRAAAN
jgi:AraC-like DNA-binding protein